MKKLTEGILFSTFLIISAFTVKVSDDEKPKVPNGADISKNVDVLIH